MSRRIDICVCTFRRPHIADTLHSLGRMETAPGWRIGIIVADNDETPDARALVEKVAQETALPVRYLHAPSCNISVARNACLEASTAPYLAFIDDDERVTRGWLTALVHALENSGADAVLGPVQAVYGPESPRWLSEGDFLSSRPVWTGGEIMTGYAGNVLLRRTSPALRKLRFRPELGRSGGEDSVFFFELYKAGGKIAFAPDAVVTETVPLTRARLRWLLSRRFRYGMTHGLLLLGAKGDGLPVRLAGAGLAAAKSGFCFMAALLTVIQAKRVRYWMLRGALHAGVAARLLGRREPELYGAG